MFRRLAVTLAIVAAAGAALYVFVVPGLSVARQEPPQLEVMLATWLLRQSVPEAARSAVNPLGETPDPAAVAAGEASVPAEMRGLSRLRRQRPDGDGRRSISASARAARDHGGALRRRDFLSHPQRHP